MNIFKINKLLNLILVVVIINFLVSFVNQQSKLNSAQKASLIEQTEELLATQQNVNSEEYIEKVAREELDMYLPNEIVYIDISK